MVCTVTIGGADDSISPTELVNISIKYPFVEWMIIVSDNHPGVGTPSTVWLEDLIVVADSLRLIGALQGRWYRDMLNGEISLKKENPNLWKIFRRIIIDQTDGHDNLADSILLIPEKEIILSDEFTGNPVNYKSIEISDHDWLCVNGFRHENGITFDIMALERFLDKIEDNISPDSCESALFETNAGKKKLLSEIP